jgi:hypothetical protein
MPRVATAESVAARWSARSRGCGADETSAACCLGRSPEAGRARSPARRWRPPASKRREGFGGIFFSPCTRSAAGARLRAAPTIRSARSPVTPFQASIDGQGQQQSGPSTRTEPVRRRRRFRWFGRQARTGAVRAAPAPANRAERAADWPSEIPTLRQRSPNLTHWQPFEGGIESPGRPVSRCAACRYARSVFRRSDRHSGAGPGWGRPRSGPAPAPPPRPGLHPDQQRSSGPASSRITPGPESGGVASSA